MGSWKTTTSSYQDYITFCLRVFWTLEQGEPQFWCKFLDFCDSNEENCCVCIPAAEHNQTEIQRENNYVTSCVIYFNIQLHTHANWEINSTSWSKILWDFYNTNTLTSKPSPSPNTNNNYNLYKNSTGIKDEKQIRVEKVRLFSRKTPWEQSQFLCQALISSTHITTLQQYSMQKEISSKSVPNTLKMPVLKNRLLSFCAVCTDN